MKLIAGILFCLVMFIVIHFIKMMRMYLVLLEQKIELKSFIFAYFRTTLVNLIVPFKLGEIYRVVVYTRLSKAFGIGFFSTLVDRFFDTLALVLIIIPLAFVSPKSLNAVSVFLAVFLIFVIFVYVTFPLAYTYLNRYIIMNRSTKRSMMALKGVETLDVAYKYVKKLVLGRYSLLILMSFLAWAMEGILLLIISRLAGIDFNGAAFLEYISSILSTNDSYLLSLYTKLGICVIAVCTIVSGIGVLIKRRKAYL